MGRTSDAKKRLVDAGCTLMHERGYTAVGVGEVCRLAGVQKGSFYHFFPSKVDLALSVIEEQSVFVEGPLEELDNRNVDPVERLVRFTNRVRETHTSVRDARGAMLGCPIGNLALEMSTQEPKLRARLQLIFENIIDRLAEVVQQAVDQGAVPPQDPKQAAQSILALLEGKVMLAKLHDNPELIGGFDADIARLLGGVSKAAATG